MLHSDIWIVKLREHETFYCTFSIPTDSQGTDLTNRGQKFYRFSQCVQSVYTVNISLLLPFSFSFLLSYSDFFLPIHCRCTGLFLPVRALYTHTHAHTHTHSLRLFCTRDCPVAEISTWQNTTQETDLLETGRFRTHNPRKREAADPCLRQRGHWDRH
jgi:hypothetical protein